MPTPIRSGTTRGGRASGGPGRVQTYDDTQSIYGPTRGDSVGPNPRNPKAYWATQAVKAYKGTGNGEANE